MTTEMNKGQAFVEYLLLILVVVSVFSFIYKSDLVQGIVGPDRNILRNLENYMRYSYRHAMSGNKEETYPPSYINPRHDSYIRTLENTRFFAPLVPYPRNN
ncbi:MAG: hypothetical protein H6621_05725 [Halobacteriovoraceae bacterium]|nr:hypothetical protein [Halobacteriovoraceae bacterium]